MVILVGMFALFAGSLVLGTVVHKENEAYWHADARTARTLLFERRISSLPLREATDYRGTRELAPPVLDGKRDRGFHVRVLSEGNAVAVRIIGLRRVVLRVVALREGSEIVIRVLGPENDRSSPWGHVSTWSTYRERVEPVLTSVVEELTAAPAARGSA